MPTVSGTVRDASGNTATWSASWAVVSQSPTLRRFGMSAPTDQWATRLAEVGANGIRARRIFCDLTSSGTDGSGTITAAHNANMIPVVSYKVPSVANAINGQYDTWANRAADFLASFGKTTYATIWHEPRGDMTPAQFVALHERLVPLMERPNLRLGPILNGFLLTGGAAQRAEWPTWTSPTLMSRWAWLGLDVYQSGTLANPGDLTAGDRIGPLMDWLDDVGHPDMPVVIGEFNGWNAASITESCEAFLDCPNIDIALLFNSSTGAKGLVLTGDMLAAFKAAKADPRVLQ